MAIGAFDRDGGRAILIGPYGTDPQMTARTAPVPAGTRHLCATTLIRAGAFEQMLRATVSASLFMAGPMFKGFVHEDASRSDRIVATRFWLESEDLVGHLKRGLSRWSAAIAMAGGPAASFRCNRCRTGSIASKAEEEDQRFFWIGA